MEHTRQTGGRESPIIPRDEVPARGEWDGEDQETAGAQAARCFLQEAGGILDVFQDLGGKDGVGIVIGNRPVTVVNLKDISLAVPKTRVRLDSVERDILDPFPHQISIWLAATSDIEQGALEMR